MYVLCYNWWEGDDHLVSEFSGIFESLDFVPEKIKNHKPDGFRKPKDWKYLGFYTNSNIKKAPDQCDGHYGAPGFYTFLEININKLIKK